MQGQHELADLAPRDVVAKAITRRMHEAGQPHMWLDGRHLGVPDGSMVDESTIDARTAFWERRFPTILSTCRSHGVDPVVDLIPVAPAEHYASGGVATDLWGRSDIPGLYATGEVACSGVHGANRLASNSLLEGLVFSRRIAQVLPVELRPWSDPVPDLRVPGIVRDDVRQQAQAVMTDLVGVLRNEAGLREALGALGTLLDDGAEVGVPAWETTNLLQVSLALAGAALARPETRGSHWREDHPERDDIACAGHHDVTLVDRRLHREFRRSPATDTELEGATP
nr:FAD-binding protein [Nocardioides alcanivorans]